MAANATMMAAIATAKKAERQKRKAAAAGIGGQQQELILSGVDVEYWSDSKGRWVEAVVMGTTEKNGSLVYVLDVKGSAPLDKVRRKIASSNVDGFVSFERLGQPRLEAERAKLQAEAEAKKDGPPEVKRIEWENPPEELLAFEDFGNGEDPSGYIEHFVRYTVGAWRREHAADYTALSDMQRKLVRESLAQTEEDIIPLLLQLRSGSTLEKGETKEDRTSRRCARGAQDGFSIAEAGVLGQLMRMASAAYRREYTDANEAYMKLTLGNKTWHNTCVVHVSASQMQGAREYRRNRDDLNTYDVDPVAQKYMHAMRRLTQFVQCLRPNEDVSKNVPL